MKLNDWDMFRLEDRVLFEAAAAAEIVDAAEAAQDNPNANVSESEKQAQEEREALKNAPPENPSQARPNGESQNIPGEPAGIDAELDKLIGVRTRSIVRKLKGVTALTQEESRQLLDMPDLSEPEA